MVVRGVEVPDEIIIDKAWNYRFRHGKIRISKLIAEVFGLPPERIGGTECHRLRGFLRESKVPVPDQGRRTKRTKLSPTSVTDKQLRATNAGCLPIDLDFNQPSRPDLAPATIIVSPDRINIPLLR